MSVAQLFSLRNLTSLSLGPLLIATLLAVPNAIAIVRRFVDLSAGERAALQLCNLGQFWVLAWCTALAASLLTSRWRPRRRSVLLGLGLLALGLGVQVLPECFDVFAEKNSARLPPLLTSSALIVSTSLSLPFAAWCGSVFARPRWRWLAVAVAALANAPNDFVLDGDYLGLHLFLTLDAYALGYAALHDVQWGSAARALLARLPKWCAWSLELGSFAIALLALGWPSRSTHQRLASVEGAPLASRVTWLHAQFESEGDAADVLSKLPAETRQWYRAVETRDAVPPSSPSLLPADPIVFLITIDSLRADIFRSPKWVEGLKFFKQLQQTAVSFTKAQSPASSTVPTLSSFFSGKYYSSLEWDPIFEGGDVWPKKDDSVRFPQLLAEHGVHTINIATKTWLLSERRVVAGFKEEYDLDQNAADRQNHVLSPVILERKRALLEQPRAGATLIYAHYMDPHSPYTSGKLKRGSNKKKLYLSEIERLDEELAEFQRWLEERGLGPRVVWIVSSDHGEAFGEHGVTFHAKNIYEELVNVPLWIRIPGVGASRIQSPVSTLDVGPTLLDLFGVPTPGHYMGQSLTPFLRGERPVLSRPIGAETHLKQSLLFPDGFKAIRDQRSGAREVYDLTRDPKESKNLIDSADPKYQAALDHFFTVHLHPRYNKRAPYRH